MALRIEYLLVFMLVILLLSIMGINPISQVAKSSKGDKEIEFQNFSLYDIQKDEPSQVMSALKMVKYENYLDMDEIDLKDENGYRLHRVSCPTSYTITLNIFYCQTNTDNGSDTSYKFTRSSLLHINH